MLIAINILMEVDPIQCLISIQQLRLPDLSDLILDMINQLLSIDFLMLLEDIPRSKVQTDPLVISIVLISFLSHLFYHRPRLI